jgi:hypothetical protein
MAATCNAGNSSQFIKKRFRFREGMNKLFGLVRSGDGRVASRSCNIREGISARAAFECKRCSYIHFSNICDRELNKTERN